MKVHEPTFNLQNIGNLKGWNAKKKLWNLLSLIIFHPIYYYKK